jgi:hypothetical protein
MILRVRGGLGNRLRVLFSHYLFCKRIHEHLTVIWFVSDACPGFYLDYFEEIDGITFLRDNSQKLKIDIATWDCHSEFNNPELLNYSNLKLKKEIYDIVRERINTLDNDYIAIQVRRTDHVESAKKNNMFTTDQDFFKFIDANIDKNLYISADNKISYNLFRSKYSDRVKFDFSESESIKSLRKTPLYFLKKTETRHTTLKDAIVDIYVCAHAKNVKVSGHSTFGELILNLHNNFIF